MTISGAVMQGGQALSPDGALYVKLDSGSAITGTTITATTQFLGPNGSVTAPTYSFTGDANTGMYNISGGGDISFAINAIEALRIGSSYQLSAIGPLALGASVAGPDAFLSRYAAKQLMISGDGTGATTNAGIIVGYYGNSTQSAIWSSTVTPSASNYALFMTNTDTVLGAVTTAILAIGNVAKATVNATGLTLGATVHLEGSEQTAPAAPAANGYRIYAQDNGAGKTQLMVLFASGAAQQIAIQP